MSSVAVTLNLIYVAVTSLMVFSHFDRREKEPFGATFISVTVVVGTITNALLWWHSVPTARAGLAIALTAAAMCLYVLAARESHGQGFWRAFSTQTPSAVVETGIYSFLRHPFYLSYILYWLSWSVLNSHHILSLLITVLMIGVYIAAALKEERQLTANFGERYIRYSDRTRMFVPWLI